jgi:hypothetical protein
MHVQKKFEVSERRACQAVGQPRSTQRYPSRKADRDRPPIERMIRRCSARPTAFLSALGALLVLRRRISRRYSLVLSLLVDHRYGTRARRLRAGCPRSQGATTAHGSAQPL